MLDYILVGIWLGFCTVENGAKQILNQSINWWIKTDKKCWLLFIFLEIGLQNLFQSQSRVCHNSPSNQYSEKKDCYSDKIQMCYHHINAGKITLLIFQMLQISSIIKLVNIFNVRLKTFEYQKFSLLPIFLLLTACSVFTTTKYIKYIRGK